MSSSHYSANIAGETEVMALTESSQRQFLQHQRTLNDLEIQKRASTIQVPTLSHQVRDALRQMGLPVRLFGENLANIRDRLRMELARRQQQEQQQPVTTLEGGEAQKQQQQQQQDEEQVTKYTRASQALVEARQEIAKFSIQRAKERLERERQLRLLAVEEKKRKLDALAMSMDEKKAAATTDTELTVLDSHCRQTYKSVRKMALQGSQYGDTRALSSIVCRPFGGDNMSLAATSSWTGSVKLWDASTAALEYVGGKKLCHEDRIMNLDMFCNNHNESALLATASIDRTAKLWKVTKSDVVMEDDTNTTDTGKANNNTITNSDDDQHQQPALFTITEQAVLQGHQLRLCQTAFHPMHQHVATTSFDYTWRLWDIETGQNLLLQDGHLRECYGIGFHHDGSLVATTDFAGVVQIWDLRTGKSIKHFLGHAKRVLNAEFHVNGFELATAGDDGTIKIWDLRKRKQAASIPAHSGLITKIKFDETGEYLASSSFDGSIKLWSCRNWKVLKELQGHEGKVTGIDLNKNVVVSSGFDKTLKLWR